MQSFLNSSKCSNSVKSNDLSMKQNNKLKEIIKSSNQAKGSLYISGIQGAVDLLAIKKLKIGCILSCEKGYLLNHPSQLVSQYKYLPFDLNQPKSLNQIFNQATSYISNQLLKTNVMVHCLTGNNKSIGIILAFFIKEDQKTLDESKQILSKVVEIKMEDKLLNALKIFQKEYLKKQLNSKKDSFIIDQSKSRIKSISKKQNSIVQNPQNQLSFTSKNKHTNILQKQESFQDKQFYHTQPKHFQMIYSSNRQKYQGVKRQRKNSKLRENKNDFSNSRKHSFDVVRNKKESQNSLNKNSSSKKQNINDFRRSLSTNQVLNTKNNSFLQVQNNRQLKTQKSKNQKLYSQNSMILEELEKSKTNIQQNDQFQFKNLSPSRILYFSDVNKNLNSMIQNIQAEYQKQSNYMRIKYAKKMASLRQQLNKFQKDKITETPYSKLKTQNLFSEYSEQSHKQIDFGGCNEGFELKLNGKHQVSFGRQKIF